MKKKFLGIPIPVVAITLALMLTAGGVMAAFLWTKEVPSTVKILGAEVEAYQDEALTTPLTALDFSEIGAGETTATVSFWLKNHGDYPVYCALAQSGLDTLLALNETDNGVVPADPGRLPLAVTLGGNWQETTTTSTLFEALPLAGTAISLDMDAASFPSSGVVKIEDELIAYASIELWGTGDHYIASGLTRGYDGTVAAAHAISTPVTLMEQIAPTYNLEPDEVLAVDLYIVADPGIARSDKPFTLVIEAKDTAY